MINQTCTLIQEEIAWNKTLNAEAQAHVLSCPECGKVALEFAGLDSQVETALGVQVPSGFAERVMDRINLSTGPIAVGSFTIIERLESYLALRSMQIGLSAAGFLFALGNIARFVLFVFVPGST